MNERLLNNLKGRIFKEKPLFLYGQRGVGKTALLEQLAGEYIYINFEYDGDMRSYIESFAGSLEAGEDDICLLVAKKLGIDPSVTGKILFIFDNLEYSPRTVNMLLRGDMSGNMVFACDIVCKELRSLKSRCYQSCMRPLGFGDFLDETGHGWYREIIEAHFDKNKKIPEMIHSDISDIYEDYLVTGGMPLAVLAYKDRGTDGVRTVQRMLKNDCRQGIAELSDGSLIQRAQAILDSMAGQLCKRKRFSFSDVRKGTSYNYYREAIDMLEDSGLITKIPSYDKGGIELYPCDHGLLSAELEKSGAEQYTANEALNRSYVINSFTSKGYDTYVWDSPYKARLDCVYVKDGSICPADIASDKNHTKSLESFVNSHPGEDIRPIRLWNRNFETKGSVRSIPIFAAFCL